ncbi:MAG: hypothetical protein WED87_03110, partial [Dehalococcoidia bacterium]
GVGCDPSRRAYYGHVVIVGNQVFRSNTMQLSGRNQLPGTIKDIKIGGIMAEVVTQSVIGSRALNS